MNFFDPNRQWIGDMISHIKFWQQKKCEVSVVVSSWVGSRNCGHDVRGLGMRCNGAGVALPIVASVREESLWGGICNTHTLDELHCFVMKILSLTSRTVYSCADWYPRIVQTGCLTVKMYIPVTITGIHGVTAFSQNVGHCLLALIWWYGLRDRVLTPRVYRGISKQCQSYFLASILNNSVILSLKICKSNHPKFKYTKILIPF